LPGKATNSTSSSELNTVYVCIKTQTDGNRE
jgi:hypothetical protein